MPDREKTISSLTTLIEGRETEEGWEPVMIPLYVVRDALALLREQEPVKPIFDEEDVSGRCGVCGHELTHQSMVGEVLVDEWYQYCPNCGRKVKWDD